MEKSKVEKLNDDETTIEATQIGLHSIKNILGNHKQTDLFSEQHQEFCEEFDVKLEGTLDRFGIDLTEVQSRIVEGILYGFSRTSYKGNVDPASKELIIQQKFSGKVPPSYKYLKELPKLRVGQSELLDWAGINKKSIASWSRAVEAIQDLGTKQYCFYYDRLVMDNEGNPVKEKNKWAKEEVISVDTLFTIKEIREKGTGSLKYYEIVPSAIFLDQRESYFMFIPFNWREEVKSLVGNKKASSYTFRFLLFLRYQYELKRRSKALQSPYKIKWSPEEIAMAIKMPSSIYVRKKKRANEILEDAYSVAKRLGYLIDYRRTGHIDTLFLNDKKYINNRSLSYNISDVLSEKVDNDLSNAKALCNLFHTQRKKLDPHYIPPEEKKKTEQDLIFHNLLSFRSLEDIEKVICWSTTRKYWCSRLSTPKKLSENFSEAWSEMTLGTTTGLEELTKRNREISRELSRKIKSKPNSINIQALNGHIEFIHGGAAQTTCIKYDNPDFENILKRCLRKYRIENI